MPANITCPHCQRLLEAPANYQGGEVRCPECQNVFVGGGPSGITAQAPKPIASSEVQSGLPHGGTPRSASPADDDFADPSGDGQSVAEALREFRPGGGLVIAVKVLLGLNLLLAVAMLGSNFLQYELAERVLKGGAVGNAELDGNDTRQMALGALNFVVYVASAIVFVMWFYRVHSNLKALAAGPLTYTPGWAAGCWFVPFLNLVRPVQIAQEIWRHSDPDVITGDYHRFAVSGNSFLVGCWWAMWLISNVISNIAMRMSWSATTPEGLKTATALAMIADLATIPAAMLALAVVWSIDARQSARAELLGAKSRSAWVDDE